MSRILMCLVGLISSIMVLGVTSQAHAAWPYNYPSYSKVKVDRNPDPDGHSWVYMEFMWGEEGDENPPCPPNFEKGRAVEFEFHILPKCFVQPIGGIDERDNCDDVMTEGNYFLPGGNDNCYVDVWNYTVPGPIQLKDDLKTLCHLAPEGEVCALAGGLIMPSDKEGNFAVGVHDASQFQPGVRYSFRYPVEIASLSCASSMYDQQGRGSECTYDIPLENRLFPHNGWGHAWINMQTFNNECDLSSNCDKSDTRYDCAQLIGLSISTPLVTVECKNVDKHSDLWMYRLCVPTNDWEFTPGYGTQTDTNGVCVTGVPETHGDLQQLGICCVDWDGDGYFAEQDAETYGTRAGDCNDWNPSVNPDAKEICDDGVDNDCDGSMSLCFNDPGDILTASSGDPGVTVEVWSSTSSGGSSGNSGSTGKGGATGKGGSVGNGGTRLP
jgi:uncharacterized membrane protein YgcG